MKFSTIVADPPWGYEGMSLPWRSASEQSYPVMALEDIKALPVANLCTANAHLYLWTTIPMMEQAYEVVRAWDFKPSTLLTWCKPGPGLGGGWRGNTEHVIVARRGYSSINPTCAICGGRVWGCKKCQCERPDLRFWGKPINNMADVITKPFLTTGKGTWFQFPRKRHSEKPEQFAEMIEQMSPGPYLEMFARTKREGWSAWGNEVDSDVEMLT